MSNDSIRKDIEKQARRALIEHAVLRWESAVTLAMTILLAIFYPAPFPWWRWYYWVILGTLGEALIIYTSLTDERTGQQVVEDLFEEQHNPRLIKTKAYREQYEKAQDYRRQIQSAIADAGDGPLGSRLERVGRDVADWVAQIYELARRLDRYVDNPIIHRDRQTVPAELRQLEQRAAQEGDPQVRSEVMQAWERKRAQWANLQQLQGTMEAARLRLDSTLTALGTVYSQILLAAAKGSEGANAESLASDIKDQIAGLQDLIETMDEILKT